MYKEDVAMILLVGLFFAFIVIMMILSNDKQRFEKCLEVNSFATCHELLK